MLIIIFQLPVLAFVINLIYELLHSVLYTTCIEMPVKKYIPLMFKASSVDAVWITIFYLITYFIFKNESPLTNNYQLGLFFAISITWAYIWEIYSLGLLQDKPSTAIFIFCLRLYKNFSTYATHMFQNFSFASPKIWKFRYENYPIKDLSKKRWEYSKNMPLIAGAGVTPLVQLFLTGVVSFYIAFNFLK